MQSHAEGDMDEDLAADDRRPRFRPKSQNLTTERTRYVA